MSSSSSLSKLNERTPVARARLTSFLVYRGGVLEKHRDTKQMNSNKNKSNRLINNMFDPTKIDIIDLKKKKKDNKDRQCATSYSWLQTFHIAST